MFKLHFFLPPEPQVHEEPQLQVEPQVHEVFLRGHQRLHPLETTRARLGRTEQGISVAQ